MEKVMEFKEIEKELLKPFDVDEIKSRVGSTFIKDGQTKYIFRDIAIEKLPVDWAKRRKLGFPVPFSKWIREEKYYQEVKEYFNQDYVSKFFDKEVINKLLEDHYQGKTNNGRKIYNIYIFLIWYKVYFCED